MDFQDYSNSMSSKLHIGHIKKPVIIGIAILAAILIGVVLFNVLNVPNASDFEVVKQESPKSSSDSSASSSTSAAESDQPHTQICVHVGGCVVQPGICYLDEGARVSDAVALCGGLSEDAAADSINLARVLSDGEQIIVPSASAVQPVEETSSRELSSAVAFGGNSASNGKVNINTADLTQLQTLSGIGESKAKKIIAYREANGPFKTVDDLTNVSGIGEKTLESLKDSICV